MDETTSNGRDDLDSVTSPQQRRRRSRNGRDDEARATLPLTLADLAEMGGPSALIKEAERPHLEEARRAGDEAAAGWLATLEEIAVGLSVEDEGEFRLLLVVQGWVKALRRRLGVKPPPDVVRAQTRERVRQHRARKAVRQ